MTGIRLLLPVLGVVFCLLQPIAGWSANDCAQQLSLLEQQNRDLHRQLREARRELVMQSSKAAEPGWPQVLGGVGAIFGLCGIGMMISARKRGRN